MIKDSGKRQQLPGMVRDVADDKVDYTLVLDGPLFDRLARHLTEGAKKYSKRNWMGAHTQEEYDRFRESMVRHLIQYLRGDTDEDHFAAVAFNLNGMEYTKQHIDEEKMKKQIEESADRSHIIHVGTEIPAEDRRRGPADRRVCYGGSMEARRLMGFGRRTYDKTPYDGLPDCEGSVR